MATQSEPSGPDLTEGVPAASLPDGGMISGHVGEEPVLLVRLGERDSRHRQQVHALRRTPRRRRRVGRHGPVPLASRMLQPEDRRGYPGACVRSRSLLACGSSR